VSKIVDHWDERLFGKLASSTDQLSRNVLQIFLEGFVVTVRPSGTEPKLKFYCQLVPLEEPQGRTAGPALRGMELFRDLTDRVEAMARAVYKELLARLDMNLEEAALLLPDLIDVDRKKEFEQTIVPKLRAAIARFGSLEELLAWLKAEATRMIPGADPLPALKASVAYLCEKWEREAGHEPLLAELRSWAAR
jgi:hypothetical protein